MQPTKASSSRKKSETRGASERTAEGGPARSETELKRLVHTLQVQQAELKMQNEELLRARTELESERTRYEELYDFAPVGFLALDSSGTVQEANLTACRLLEIERRALVGRPLASLLAPESRPAFRRHLALVFRTPERRVARLGFNTRSGRVEVSLESIATSGSRVCLSALSDAGELERAERELRAKTEEAATRAAELDAARSELAEVREAAARSSRSRTEVLARMSLEIRTAMNGILGMSELALAEERLPTIREYLHISRHSALDLLAIVNDALDLLQIHPGGLEFEPRPFEVRAALASVLSGFRLAVRDKGVRLELRVAPEVPRELLGEEVRLRQVATKLVANAVGFTTRGEVEVAVELASEARSDPGRIRLLFSVRDTGVGIPPEDLDHVLDEFSTPSRPAQAQLGGNGLGLSISRRLVALMGGRIWAESTPGEGSVFRFTAEFGVPAAAPARSQTARVPARLRVLVAEDDRCNQIVALEALHRLGHEAVLAVDGEEALESLSRGRFDVVLMDVGMPKLDGYEAVKRIRAGLVKRCPADIPVIALTAHALKGDRERLLAAGIDDYVSKPFKPDALEQALRRVVRAPG